MAWTHVRKEALAVLCHGLWAHRGLTAATVAVLTGAALLEGIGIGLVVPVLQALNSAGRPDGTFGGVVAQVFSAAGLQYSFAMLVAVLGAAMFGRYLLEALYQHLARVLASAITFEMRDRAFRNLMDLPLSFHHARNTGDTVSTLHTSTLSAGAAVELILQIAIGVLFIGVYLGLGFMLSLPLTLVVLGLSCVAYVLILPKFKIGFIQGHEEKIVVDRIASFLIDVLSGIKTVKTFHGESRHAAEFRGLARDFQRLAVRVQDNRILAWLSLEPLLMLMALAMLVVSVSVLHLPVAYLLTFFFIVSRTLPRIRAANTQILETLNCLPHVLKVKALVDRDDKAYLTSGTRAIASLRDAVTFDAITFCYAGNERPALRDLSLRVEKNRMTALIGASGGGKTTLVNLLLKHHEPDAGTIRVDGIDLRELRRDDWHRLVALVEQDAHLFNTTVLENITYGREGSSEEDAIRAASLANAHGFISELPEGYQTHVGERGVKLSGGQRQRIALARALIRDPEILIMDEATSSLDAESEQLIQRSIEELGRTKTLIVIAHRLSTIAKADRLYVLEDGMIVEEGEPQTLLADGGMYQKYRAMQLR